MATVIKGGKRFNSVKGQFEANESVVVEGKQIIAVDGLDAAGNSVSAQGAEVVDAQGKTVIPGLFNLHGHLAWDGFSDLEHQTRYDGPTGYLKAARGLRAAVEAGVTTFRDLGCVHDTGLSARDAVRDGFLPGPTVIACARAICRTGGHIWWGNRVANGADDVRAAVREQVRDGADWIKLMSHGYTQEEINAAVDQAHEEGVRITTDAGAWADRAVKAGVDCIEHGGDYSDELTAQIAEKGIWIVPTVSPVVLQSREGAAWGMKQSVIDRRTRSLESGATFRGLIRCRLAGVRIALGTDSGSPVVPHDAMLPEMQAWLEFGLFDRPEEVLQAATFWAAQCVGIHEQTGSLEAGKQADLVVLDGDLEADLAVVKSVNRVYVKGHLTVEGGRSILPDPRDFQTFANVGA